METPITFVNKCECGGELELFSSSHSPLNYNKLIKLKDMNVRIDFHSYKPKYFVCDKCGKEYQLNWIDNSFPCANFNDNHNFF